MIFGFEVNSSSKASAPRAASHHGQPADGSRKLLVLCHPPFQEAHIEHSQAGAKCSQRANASDVHIRDRDRRDVSERLVHSHGHRSRQPHQ
eukprot:286729-Prymnesium_polylepis.1